MYNEEVNSEYTPVEQKRHKKHESNHWRLLIFGINYIKNGFNKLNFILNYIIFDVIYAKKVL